MATDSAAWFEKHPARGTSALRLFCIPHAGGSGYRYRDWIPQLPDWVDVYGIRLPGRGPRISQTAFHHMPSLITALGEVMVEQLDRPFALLGHSMGALIAFELAAHLQQRGMPACHLFASGARAPHIPRGEKELHLLPREAFIRELRKLNGTAPEILEDEGMISSFLPLLRADFELVETYVAPSRPALHCPITALGGESDETVSEQQLQDWSAYTAQGFRRVMFPGEHFFIATEEAAVLRLVGETLVPLRT